MTAPIPAQRANQSLLDFIKNLLVQRAPADATAVVPRGAAVNPVTGMQGNNALSAALEMAAMPDPFAYATTSRLRADPAEMDALVSRFAADPSSRPDSAGLAQRTHSAEDAFMRSSPDSDMAPYRALLAKEDTANALKQAGRPEMDPRKLAVLAKILAKGKAP